MFHGNSIDHYSLAFGVISVSFFLEIPVLHSYLKKTDVAYKFCFFATGSSGSCSHLVLSKCYSTVNGMLSLESGRRIYI
jgi:hypothetical protein